MQAVPLTSRRVHVFPVQCHVVLVFTNAVHMPGAKQARNPIHSILVRSLAPFTKANSLARNEDALALTTGTHRLDADSCTTTPPPLDNLGSGDGGARAVPRSQ